ncbi:hypothetical protein NQZ68_002875 [Dissostichus eleginoides]|nr:hypothetical protein NQZ68_002875 [Dissostichus eleginoides]
MTTLKIRHWESRIPGVVIRPEKERVTQGERPVLSAELNGNNLTRITKSDFAGLKYIRVLQLMENQITVIERGAFDDMKELERLRLNRNQLQQLPELLFQKNPALSRLGRAGGRKD